MKEVARRAGVSTATVSRVLSGAALVSSDLAERVHSAARELNYRPNRIARNLRAREAKMIGVLVPDIENPFFTSVISGIEEVLQEADYTLILANYGDDPARETKLLTSCAGEGVGGMIFTPSAAESPAYREMLDAGVPMVAVSRKPATLDVDVVGTDNQGGTREGVRHLLKLGHRRIAFINGTLAVSTAREREAGYRQAHEEAGVAVGEALIVHTDWRHGSASEAMRRLLELGDPPTAVFCGGGILTLGALHAIHKRGWRIPEEIAIVGFDDLVWATSLRPSLTAVAQPAVEQGKLAAHLLLERVGNPEGERRCIELPTTLIVRDSCGWPRKGSVQLGKRTGGRASEEWAALAQRDRL